MEKEKYQAPRIFVCEVEAQPVLAGSTQSTNGSFKVEKPVTYGDDDDVWDTESAPEN